MHIEWDNTTIYKTRKSIPVKHDITIPIKDKIRIRNMMRKNDTDILLMAKQGDTWYILKCMNSETERPAVEEA